MQPSNQRIPVEKVTLAGEDWAGYGELTGPQFLNLLQQDKIRVLFANTHMLISVMRPDGLVGTYILRHEELTAPAPQSATPTELTSELDHVFSFQELWPLIDKYGQQYGFSPQVIAGIMKQESGFKNWRVHLDGTGFGLFGLDDNGLLPEFERWSGLQVGRGSNHQPVSPNKQIEYAAMQLKRYQDQLGDPLLAAQAWHRGMGAYTDQRGVDYGNLIRAHIRSLFGT